MNSDMAKKYDHHERHVMTFSNILYSTSLIAWFRIVPLNGASVIADFIKSTESWSAFLSFAAEKIRGRLKTRWSRN